MAGPRFDEWRRVLGRILIFVLYFLVRAIREVRGLFPSEPAPMLARCSCFVLALNLSIVVAGCARGPATGKVNGEVTLDGQPLTKGHVEFSPLDGQGQTGGAIIANGQFSAEIPVAKMKVAIHSPKVVGKRKAYDTPESPWEDEVAEALPPRYHINSDITLDVQPGTQAVRYDLKSK
jgi:hypothetical protein